MKKEDISILNIDFLKIRFTFPKLCVSLSPQN